MDDGLERGAGFVVREDNSSELRPIEGARRQQDVRAKPVDDRSEAPHAGSDDFARERVRVDGGNAEILESGANPRLAGRDSACQRNTAHARVSASLFWHAPPSACS